MKKKIDLIYWFPRGLCILAILFISMFALDAFEPGMPLGKQLLGFLIHMIPSLILTLFLILAWKWEIVGAVLFCIIGMGFMPFIFNHNLAINHSVGFSLLIVLIINVPLVLVGGLFLLSALKKRRLN